MTTYRPNRPQRSHRGIWLNILLNISLLGFLIFVARPFLSSLGPSSGAEGLVEIKGNTAIVPGTDIRVPVSKSDGVTRVIFVGAPPPGFASDDPFAHDMAGRAAMQAKGLTLEVFHLAAPDWTIGELARVAATAALLNPDLLVISPAAATPLVPAGTDEAALAASLADLLAPRTTPPPREESPTAMLERLSRPRRLLAALRENAKAAGAPAARADSSPEAARLRTEVRDAIILEMARVLASAGRDVRRGVIGGFGAMAPADDATPLSAWRALPADTARKIAQATGAAFFDATPFLDTGDVDARQDRLAQWMVLNL